MPLDYQEELYAYEESLKVFRDLGNVINTAEKKGLQKGLQEGIRKGREEEKLEVARSTKDMGMSVEQIMKLTGLSAEEIESLG